MDKRNGADEKSTAGRKLRLKELAAEASRHLDEILPGGVGADEKERGLHAGVKPTSEDPTARSSAADKGGGARSFTKGRSIGDIGQSSASVLRSPEDSKTASGTLGVARESGRAHQGSAAAGAGRPAALVVHVSYGMASLLASMLNRMGFHAGVATNSVELDSHLSDRNWDLLFVQGTSTPYPGKKLASAALSRCTGSRPRVILISRPGDSLLPEAGATRATGLIQWPFSPATVRRALAEVLPLAKEDKPR